MKVAVRADASGTIGTGHLRRCLSLAAALVDLGAELCFVVRRHDDVAGHVMASAGYPVFWLPAAEAAVEFDVGAPPHAAWAQVPWQRDGSETAAALKDFGPDWVIVDHYGFDAQWHDRVREYLSCAILAIDDLGDRPLAADIVLDANAATSHADKYAGRVSSNVRMLTGPRFAPLSPVYRDAPRYVFSSQVRSLGVFLGGTDADGVSAKVVRSLRDDAGFRGAIEVVSTSGNPRLGELKAVCDAAVATLTIDLADLSAFYTRHDLQIGAGGTSSYERCCLGVPTVAVVLAANQLAVVPFLIELGVVRGAALPDVEATRLLPDLPALGSVVRELVDEPEQRRALSCNAARYVDGRGAQRVALVMFADLLTVRAATIGDSVLLHTWRNDPATRAVSINTGGIEYADHLRWLTGTLASSARKLFVAMVGTQPVGVIRFDLFDDDTCEVSLYVDPGLHGLGLGTRMLVAGEAAVMCVVRGTMQFHAQIVPGNGVSKKMFERVGYEGSAGRLTKTRYQEDAA